MRRGNSLGIEAWKLSGNRGVDFKNTGLAKSTPRGTVWVAVVPDGVHICDVIVLSANRNGFQVT